MSNICTLKEDPEDRLDEEILNGVALRPRVNSVINRRNKIAFKKEKNNTFLL